MKIKINIFPAAGRQQDTGEFEITADESSTIEDVLSLLKVADTSDIITLVNGKPQDKRYQMQPDDLLYVLPRLRGG